MIKQRVETIQKALAAGEGFLVESVMSRFYYTGFETSAGAVLITPNSSSFLIDFRYFEKAKEIVESSEVLLSNRTDGEIKELCEKYGVKRLYVETTKTSVGRFGSLQKAFDGIEISGDDKFDRLTEDMRAIKTREELSFIKKAQEYTDETFEYILPRIEIGRTEKEIMLDMEFFMRKLGSEGVSFDFIVVSGKNSSLPHGVPTDKKIEKGDFITMDFGAVYKGYHSDMTRTVAVGCASNEQKLVYNTVLKAQEAALEKVRAGLVCKDVDKIARDIIYSKGFEGCFGHGLGHSLGIQIHEDPRFNTVCETILKPGMVMTVEPGIYLENRFGVRIEDMVYVTENGAENLTKSRKELIIL